VSSPQLENGYTRIANELLEALAKVKLLQHESRVLFLILRQTYGREGKKFDRIALSQIAEATGLDRGNAGRALRSLKKKNMIIERSGLIGLQKDYEQWEGWPGVSAETPVSAETLCLLRPQNGVCTDLKMVSAETPQKKERKKKDSAKGKPSRSNGSDPRVKEFFDWWHVEYQKRFNEPYVFAGGKEGTQIKRVLGSFDLPRVKLLAASFITSNDPWIRQYGGYTIGVFVGQINKLVSTAKAMPLRPELPL
jgi:phage replication O-like protein O